VRRVDCLSRVVSSRSGRAFVGVRLYQTMEDGSAQLDGPEVGCTLTQEEAGRYLENAIPSPHESTRLCSRFSFPVLIDLHACARAALQLERNWIRGRPHVMTLSGHTGTVTCVGFDDRRLISGSDDGSLILWSLDSGVAAPSNSRVDATAGMFQQHHKNTKITHRMQSFVGHGG
jgi:WD40 repeat protein